MSSTNRIASCISTVRPVAYSPVDEWANSATNASAGKANRAKDCPWNAESNEHATQSVIYSARTGSWYEITCLELDWFNEGPCVLFSGHPVDEHSRSLFTSLSEPSSYDELFELNLTDDAYKILYHEPENSRRLRSRDASATCSPTCATA